MSWITIFLLSIALAFMAGAAFQLYFQPPAPSASNYDEEVSFKIPKDEHGLLRQIYLTRIQLSMLEEFEKTLKQKKQFIPNGNNTK